jgi:hypothetical protein
MVLNRFEKSILKVNIDVLRFVSCEAIVDGGMYGIHPSTTA